MFALARGLVAGALRSGDGHILQAGILYRYLYLCRRFATVGVGSRYGKYRGGGQRLGERTSFGRYGSAQGRTPSVGVRRGSAYRLGKERRRGILVDNGIIAGNHTQCIAYRDFEAVGIDVLRSAIAFRHPPFSLEDATLAELFLAQGQGGDILTYHNVVQVPEEVVAVLNGSVQGIGKGFVIGASVFRSVDAHVVLTRTGVHRKLERQGVQRVALAARRIGNNHGTVQTTVHRRGYGRYVQARATVHIQGCRHIAPCIAVVGGNLPVVAIGIRLVSGYGYDKVRAVAFAYRRSFDGALSREIGTFFHIHLNFGFRFATVSVHGRKNIGGAVGDNRRGERVVGERCRRPCVLHSGSPSAGNDAGKGNRGATEHRGIGHGFHHRNGVHGNLNRIAAQGLAALAVFFGIEGGHRINAVAGLGIGQRKAIARAFLHIVHKPFDGRCVFQAVHNCGELHFFAFADNSRRLDIQRKFNMFGRIHTEVERIAAGRIVLAVQQTDAVRISFHVGVVAVGHVVVRIGGRSIVKGYRLTVDVPVVAYIAQGHAFGQAGNGGGEFNRFATAYGVVVSGQVHAYRSVGVLGADYQGVGAESGIADAVGSHLPYHGIAFHQNVSVGQNAVVAGRHAVHEPGVMQVVVAVIERDADLRSGYEGNAQRSDIAALIVGGSGNPHGVRLERFEFRHTAQEIAVVVVFHRTARAANGKEVTLPVFAGGRIVHFPTAFVEVELPAVATAVVGEVEAERLVPQSTVIVDVFQTEHHGAFLTAHHIVEFGIRLEGVGSINALPAVGGGMERAAVPPHRVCRNFRTGIGNGVQRSHQAVGQDVMQLERIGSTANIIVEGNGHQAVSRDRPYRQFAYIRHEHAVDGDAVGRRQVDAVAFATAERQTVGREFEIVPANVDTNRI